MKMQMRLKLAYAKFLIEVNSRRPGYSNPTQNAQQFRYFADAVCDPESFGFCLFCSILNHSSELGDQKMSQNT